VCVCDKSPLCRFTESDSEAGLCQRADITQHNLQKPSQNTQPRSLSTRPFPQISLTHTHTHTKTITFTHSHRHTLMLMHKHTLMLLLIQAHTCSTQSPSTPAKKNQYASHPLQHSRMGQDLYSHLLLSFLCSVYSFLWADTKRQNVYTALQSL